MTANLSIDRETASRINPLISESCVEDTAIGLVQVIKDLGYLVAFADNRKCVTEIQGIYPMFEAIAGALEYEAKHGCSTRRIAEKEPESV